MENREAKEILGRYIRLKRKNSGSIEAYQVKVRHKLGLALLAAAKVLRELGLDEASAGEEDPDEDPE